MELLFVLLVAGAGGAGSGGKTPWQHWGCSVICSGGTKPSGRARRQFSLGKKVWDETLGARRQAAASSYTLSEAFLHLSAAVLPRKAAWWGHFVEEQRLWLTQGASPLSEQPTLSREGTGVTSKEPEARELPARDSYAVPAENACDEASQKGFIGVKSQIPAAQGSFYIPSRGCGAAEIAPAEREAAEHFP